MLAVKGIYQNGHLILKEKVPFTEPITVIVTFLEEPKTFTSEKLDLDQFSFAQSREILKNVKSSFSDALIAERRDALCMPSSSGFLLIMRFFSKHKSY